MILLILLISLILFAYFMIIPGKGHKYIATLGLILFTLSIGSISMHDHQQFGMVEKIKTSTHSLSSSASPQFPVLLYQPLGNGTEKVYLYKTSPKQKKVKPISTNNSSAKVKFTSDKTAKLEIKTTRYVFKNKTMQLLFGVFGHEGELKHRQYTFIVPKNWKVLSVKEAKALQKKLAKQAMLQKQMMLKQQQQQAGNNK